MSRAIPALVIHLSLCLGMCCHDTFVLILHSSLRNALLRRFILSTQAKNLGGVLFCSVFLAKLRKFAHSV